MTILRDLSIMWTALFSLILMLTLFESRYSLQKTLTLSLSFMLPLLAGNMVLLFLLGAQTMGTLLLLTSTLPSLIFFFFLSRHRDGRFFFTFCLADTMILEILYTTSVLDFFLGDTYVFMFATRILLCPLLAWVVGKYCRAVYLKLQNTIEGGWYIFTVIALIFYVVLSMSANTPTLITRRPEQLPAFLLLLLLMPILYLFIFYTLQQQENAYTAAERENILQVQVASLHSRMAEFSEANDRLREERHNFRHKMGMVLSLAKNGQYTELTKIAREYTDALPEKTTQSYCSHTILDSVLSYYLQHAQKKGIRVMTKLVFPDILPVDEAELATVFANALENAIHACEQQESKERSIEITSIVEPCFMFQIKNSFTGTIAFNEAGIPLSSKKGHGFGTHSIATFCDKNHAYYEFKTQGTEFLLKIIFSDT